MDWVADNFAEIVSALLMLIGGASIIAKLTPTPKDDKFLAKLRGLVETVAMNPKNKNK